jgi:hypothetical protein
MIIPEKLCANIQIRELLKETPFDVSINAF